MSPNRLTKMLARRFMVSWREQPTRYDIEALQANTERVGLVIRVRWALVVVLSLYSAIAAWAYAIETPWAELMANMRVPAVTLMFVLAYNFFYWRTYRRLGNISVLNHAQLMFDAIVVTVLVYYSGGVHSWFWAMYSLFILEAAFILPKRWHAWMMAGFCALCLAVVVWGEYFGLLPHVTMPFISEELHRNLTFVAVRYGWQLTVLGGTATVAALMTGAMRQREAELASASIVDDKTGLYDRGYFLRALNREILRAERDEQHVTVILADIDEFDRYNKLFGIDRGDRLLRRVAVAMSDAIAECSSGGIRETNVVSRFGGEEFAIILTEDCHGVAPTLEDSLGVAEAVRAAVAAVHIEDAGVTVSVGVARFPEDGMTSDQLMDVADAALTRSASAGGNRVFCAESDA